MLRISYIDTILNEPKQFELDRILYFYFWYNFKKVFLRDIELLST